MRISGTFKNRCVERAITTMRAALGYDDEPPRDLFPAGIIDYEILDRLPLAFVGRAIRVYHSDSGKFEALRSSAWEYMGSIYNTTEGSNNWLTAFAYADSDESESGHMAIGEPVVYEGTKLLLVFSVELKNGV